MKHFKWVLVSFSLLIGACGGGGNGSDSTGGGSPSGNTLTLPELSSDFDDMDFSLDQLDVDESSLTGLWIAYVNGEGNKVLSSSNGSAETDFRLHLHAMVFSLKEVVMSGGRGFVVNSSTRSTVFIYDDDDIHPISANNKVEISLAESPWSLILGGGLDQAGFDDENYPSIQASIVSNREIVFSLNYPISDLNGGLTGQGVFSLKAKKVRSSYVGNIGTITLDEGVSGTIGSAIYTITEQKTIHNTGTFSARVVSRLEQLLLTPENIADINDSVYFFSWADGRVISEAAGNVIDVSNNYWAVAMRKNGENFLTHYYPNIASDEVVIDTDIDATFSITTNFSFTKYLEVESRTGVLSLDPTQ